MSEIVKAAIILAAAALLITAALIYFSPYQTCLRTYEFKKAGASDCLR